MLLTTASSDVSQPQPHQHLHPRSTLSSLHTPIRTFAPCQHSHHTDGKRCKWNTIPGGGAWPRNLLMQHKYLQDGGITRQRKQRNWNARPRVQSLFQAAVYSWQDLGMLFKLPLSLSPCPPLQNQLISRDENQFFWALSSWLLLLWGQNSLTKEDYDTNCHLLELTTCKLHKFMCFCYLCCWQITAVS